MPGFLVINAEKQGKIEGDCTKKGVEKTIEVISFTHQVKIPKNKNTGLYTGTRVHKPIVVQKEIDKSTPKLYQALCEGENLTELDFSWYRFVQAGSPEKFYKVTVNNARIISIDPWVPHRYDPKYEMYPHFESVKFSYDEIRWTWLPDGSEYVDKWKET